MIALALSLLAAWHPAQVLEPFPLDEPQIAPAPGGGAYVVGIQSLDERDDFIALRRLSLRQAPSTGKFGTPAILDATRWEASGAGVDATGQATALLTSKEGLAASLAPPGGSLGLIQPLSRTARNAQLAVAPSGAAAAAWLEGGHVVAAVREPGATAFGAPQSVSGRVPGTTRIIVAAGSRGDALLAWTDGDLFWRPAAAALRRPGGGFAAPVDVVERAGSIYAAIGDDGTAALALTRMTPVNGRERIDGLAFVAPPAAAQLPRPQTIACREGVEGLAAAAARALLVCHARDLEIWEGGARLSRTARLPAKRLTGDDGVRADVTADGRALVSWSRAQPTFPARARVVAAMRAPGGRFGAPRPITRTYAAVAPRAARLTGTGALVIAETFGNGGRSMLAVWGR